MKGGWRLAPVFTHRSSPTENAALFLGRDLPKSLLPDGETLDGMILEAKESVKKTE